MTQPGSLVSLAEARAHIRSDDNDDDVDLWLKVNAASKIVLSYVDRGLLHFKNSSGAFVTPYVDSGGKFIPPEDMKLATLMMVGYLYAQRDADANQEFADGRLPRPVRALLASYRSLVS